ncbi:MAG: aspartate kinase [Candidatus Kaiserbacteria bacterium]|nr:aspartate kinase [Candidatus Kaiserbacteria bacterium]
MLIVSKFGGTSSADANMLLKIKAFLESNPDRRYAIVSAPGKRHTNDVKMTNLLRECVFLAKRGESYNSVLNVIESRLKETISQLGVEYNLTRDFDLLRDALKEKACGFEAYVESRGEFFNGKILASLMGWPFVDTKECIRFDKNGFNPYLSNALVQNILSTKERAVIPGYYGSSTRDGSIRLFSRGGSDITGAIVAQAVGADLYENVTDVDGVFAADPGIVMHAKTIPLMTYQELREMAHGGAGVIHPDALLPVKRARIPTRVLHLLHPEGPYTDVISDLEDNRKIRYVGVAAKSGFAVITVKNSSMTYGVGFAKRLLQVLVDFDINFEQMPSSSLDSVSLIINHDQLPGTVLQNLVEAIKKQCTDDYNDDDSVSYTRDGALVCVIGLGMVGAIGASADIFVALKDAGVNISTINQGATEEAILIGIHPLDMDRAVLAIHDRCIAPQ